MLSNKLIERSAADRLSGNIVSRLEFNMCMPCVTTNRKRILETILLDENHYNNVNKRVFVKNDFVRFRCLENYSITLEICGKPVFVYKILIVNNCRF